MFMYWYLWLCADAIFLALGRHQGMSPRDNEFGALFLSTGLCDSCGETPMSAGRKIAALALALFVAAWALGRAQSVTVRKMPPGLMVRVRAEISGDVSVSAWSRTLGREAAPALSQVVHCQGNVKADDSEPNMILCSRALRRDGLALEGVIDPAPIARSLDPSTGVELWLDSPRQAIDSFSAAMTEEDGGDTRSIRSIRFQAGSPPPPIHIRFGYRPDQMTGIYLPLVALALAMTMIAIVMSRAGLAALSRSAVLLGTIVWMGAAAQLHADGPLRILLYATPLANVAALLIAFWPPLICIAFGVAIGSRMRPGQTQGGKAGEILGGFAVIPLLLTCAMGSLPSFTRGDWTVTALWIAAAPIILLLRRAWIRKGARSRIVQLSSGELKERVAALAARAGCPQVKVYISYSKRSETSNAFALPGKSIFLTAPLIRSLSKREVDSVAAHELSHFRDSYRGVWMSLGIAMVLCETPARDMLLYWPAGLFIAMLVPITVFFASLRGMRGREFFADAGAAALTGDPRAMISSLARIARSNNVPLEMNAVAELFSSHPSTPKRIRALAAAARLDPAEVEVLCGNDDPGDRYELPQEGQANAGAIFTPAWQKINAGIYGWVVIFASCGASLLVAWLLSRFTGAGVVPVCAGIALGCILTKALAAAQMSANFAGLRRRLEARLGVSGQLVGLAPDSAPGLYNGFRFSDAGLLRFENGRLCYRSERISIALNPADVAEVAMVAASPSNWVRRQPMVRFRRPESGAVQAFILHPVDWLPTQSRLLKSIERWKAAGTSPQSTEISGLTPTAGLPFTNPTIIDAVRGFLVTGGITLLTAVAARSLLQAEWWYVICALAVAACAHVFLFLPSMIYRPPSLPAKLTAPLDAN
jgi:heat shock protein HtpX